MCRRIFSTKTEFGIFSYPDNVGVLRVSDDLHVLGNLDSLSPNVGQGSTDHRDTAEPVDEFTVLFGPLYLTGGVSHCKIIKYSINIININ
jgi:hypothetical protein